MAACVRRKNTELTCACVGGEVSVNRIDMCLYIIGASCRKCHFCRDKLTTSIPLSRQTLVFLAGAAYDIYIDRSGLHVQVTRDMRAIGSE